MRRLLQFALLVVFVTASTTGVHASTDCERWFIAYKQQLAHTQSVQRIEAARRRARMYAKRKLAGYVKPATPKPHVPRRRPMSREETLHHFNLACGVLPEESRDQPLVAEEKPAEFVPQQPSEDILSTIPDGDGTEVASFVPPPYVPPGFTPPVEGGAPIYYPPYGGPGGGTPKTPGGPGGPGGPGSPPPVVPEPESLVLVLTGLAAAADVIRRRFKE